MKNLKNNLNNNKIMMEQVIRVKNNNLKKLKR